MKTRPKSDDNLTFSEAEPEKAPITEGIWKILIVDDEDEVHKVTKLALNDVHFENRSLEFISAYSGKEAEETIEQHPDLAIILLDVVMETDDSGLGVIKFVREQLCNKRVRIILRTGQPGHAPETAIIVNYDINDYKAKTELTAQKLLTTIIASLRAYKHVATIEANRLEIDRLYNELTVYSENLESLVEKRTEELADLNQNLERLVDEKTKQLIKQEKSAIIGRLLQGMVHNLRTPLTAIRGLSYLIHEKSESHGDEVISKHSDSIDGACEKMEQMMRCLMIKSRNDSSDEFKPINVNSLVKHELELFDAHRQFKSEVKTEISLDSNVEAIPLIYSNISQVCHNLINNALDSMFSSEQKTLKITTRQDQEALSIDIEDSGCGIAADKLEFIFDPFYTSKPAEGDAERGEPTGTGLGLHTCVELLKPFGGKMTVRSEPQKGTTFTVQLPRRLLS